MIRYCINSAGAGTVPAHVNKEKRGKLFFFFFFFEDYGVEERHKREYYTLSSKIRNLGQGTVR